MKQQDFEETNGAGWAELERKLAALEGRKGGVDLSGVPQLFRKACADLSLAQHRMYGRKLCDRLNSVVIGVYQQLSRGISDTRVGIIEFVGVKLPRVVREEWRLFWLNMALFWVPLIGFVLAAYFNPEWIDTVLGPETRSELDKMYGGDSIIDNVDNEGKYRSDILMFGFYIWNNVSIDFKVFAMGAFCTVGGFLGIGFNGIYLGAMFGYMHEMGYLWRFYTFVAGHSSFEIIGMILCGVAGMKLGLAIVKPGRLTRGVAMKEAGVRALPLLYGGAGMTIIAAVLEAFWSGSPAAGELKIGVGVTLWVMMTMYLLIGGRGRNEA